MRVYAFPEDIGVRKGIFELLDAEFLRTVTEDRRQKRFVDVQRHFQRQVVSSSPIRLLLFMKEEQRGPAFRVERLSMAQTVSQLIQEYISNEEVPAEEAAVMFDAFTDLAAQAPGYLLWLSPDTRENARQVRALLAEHRR
jgi:hypothetical protein